MSSSEIFLHLILLFWEEREGKLGAEMSHFQDYLNFSNVLSFHLERVSSQCHVMNEQLNFGDQENASQIHTCYFNETQLNHDDKSQKEKRPRKHWTSQLESWLIFG